MKKFLFVLSLALLTGLALFAEEYLVKSVTGKVTYQNAPGSWLAVKVGQKLTSSTNINTSSNSKLVLILEDKSEATIKSMKKGTIDSLLKASAKLSNSKGIKNSAGGIKKQGAAGAVEENSKGVLTASSRANIVSAPLDVEDSENAESSQSPVPEQNEQKNDDSACTGNSCWDAK